MDRKIMYNICLMDRKTMLGVTERIYQMPVRKNMVIEQAAPWISGALSPRFEMAPGEWWWLHLGGSQTSSSVKPGLQSAWAGIFFLFFFFSFCLWSLLVPPPSSPSSSHLAHSSRSFYFIDIVSDLGRGTHTVSCIFVELILFLPSLNIYWAIALQGSLEE